MFIVNKEHYDRQELERRINAIYALRGSSVWKERRIAVCMKEPLNILAATELIIRNDGSVLLINGDTPIETAIRQAEDAGCMGMLTDAGGGAVFHPLHSSPDRINGEPSLLQFSSGTTGAPKLVERSWSHVQMEIEAYNKMLPCSGEDRPIILVPVSHSFGLIAGTLSALQRGVEPVIVTDKNPKFVLHLMQHHDRHVVYAVPFLYQILLSLMREKVLLRKMVTSGSPMSSGLLDRLVDSGVEVIQQYGCSEAGCISIGDRPSGPTDTGLLLEHMAIERAGTRDQPDEIIIATGGARIHTGDMGYWSDGRLHVQCRMDDLINVSGLKVAPSEVEDVIRRLDGVQEAVVHKAPHPVWGEAVKARIVRKGDNLSQEEVKRWCTRFLPAYKVPGFIAFTEDIPKTSTGKVMRKQLVEEEYGN
ncbi:AMP-binding protein [Paenibacillus kobensis]|uniref:AMP-binding protein n=1 Tax=Paenibacillus kobensis TaxID=59841 RepID=UPI000FDC5821|nr:AMP-binding protein [Paenibacillus kobensis]